MEQQTKPKRIDGQKKFTAILSGVVLSVIGLLVTNGVIGDNVASSITQLGAVALPILGTFLYTLVQGSHDKVKIQKDIVEIEKRYLLPPKEVELPAPKLKPKRIDFKAFATRVLGEAEKDKDGRPKATALFYALISEGKQTEVESLLDVWEYGDLMIDASKRKFEELNHFSIDDPNLTQRLRTIGKCPYSTVEAFCTYEGNRTALLDVREANRNLASVAELIQEDFNSYWLTNFDTSLYGLWLDADRLVKNLRMKGV